MPCLPRWQAQQTRGALLPQRALQAPVARISEPSGKGFVPTGIAVWSVGAKTSNGPSLPLSTSH